MAYGQSGDWYGMQGYGAPPAANPMTAPAAGGYTIPFNEGSADLSGGRNRRKGRGKGGLGVPEFTAPEFAGPGEMETDPSFQFRLQQGVKAMDMGAAAKGTLRTGGHGVDLGTLGQNMASQEYGNMFNRSLGVHDRNFQGAQAEFAPKMAQWEEQMMRSRPRGGGGGPNIPPPPMAPPPYEY